MEVEIRMLFNSITFDLNIITKAFKLKAIGERPKAIDCIILLKREINEIFVIGSETSFVIIRHTRSSNAAGVVITTMQSGD